MKVVFDSQFSSILKSNNWNSTGNLGQTMSLTNTRLRNPGNIHPARLQRIQQLQAELEREYQRVSQVQGAQPVTSMGHEGLVTGPETMDSWKISASSFTWKESSSSFAWKESSSSFAWKESSSSFTWKESSSSFTWKE